MIVIWSRLLPSDRRMNKLIKTEFGEDINRLMVGPTSTQWDKWPGLQKRKLILVRAAMKYLNIWEDVEKITFVKFEYLHGENNQTMNLMNIYYGDSLIFKVKGTSTFEYKLMNELGATVQSNKNIFVTHNEARDDSKNDSQWKISIPGTTIGMHILKLKNADIPNNGEESDDFKTQNEWHSPFYMENTGDWHTVHFDLGGLAHARQAYENRDARWDEVLPEFEKVDSLKAALSGFREGFLELME